jgi:hypothetical protein
MRITGYENLSISAETLRQLGPKLFIISRKVPMIFPFFYFPFVLRNFQSVTMQVPNQVKENLITSQLLHKLWAYSFCLYLNQFDLIEILIPYIITLMKIYSSITFVKFR